jgi:biopolymer transport protein ExbD
MALGKRRKVEEEAEIDLTPMLDVVFIMLIFFIVTASFVKEAGFDVNRPPAVAPQDTPEKKKNAVFKVTANNEIWSDNRRVDVRSVRAVVERIRAENPQAKVIIQANENARTDTFVQISDQAREAKVYDISLTTTKNR